MLKKTTLVLSVLLICLSLVACGAPGITTLPDDKVAFVLPVDLVPSGVVQTKDNVSSSYFISDMTLPELEEFYGLQFETLGVEGIVSYDVAKLVELELLPQSADGNTVLWASYGTYTQVVEIEETSSDTAGSEVASTESSAVTTGETSDTAESAPTTQTVPICVTVAQDEMETAVMVAVGAQATRMALAHKLTV